jgi:PatG Domain
MEQPEGKKVSTNTSASGNDTPAPVASAARPAVSSLAPQPCPTCGAAPATNVGVAATPSYVYAIGRIEPRFPQVSVEKELAQVTGRADTAGLSDRQALQKVLSERQNRYLVRQLWDVLQLCSRAEGRGR